MLHVSSRLRLTRIDRSQDSKQFELGTILYRLIIWMWQQYKPTFIVCRIGCSRSNLRARVITYLQDTISYARTIHLPTTLFGSPGACSCFEPGINELISRYYGTSLVCGNYSQLFIQKPMFLPSSQENCWQRHYDVGRQRKRQIKETERNVFSRYIRNTRESLSSDDQKPNAAQTWAEASAAFVYITRLSRVVALTPMEWGCLVQFLLRVSRGKVVPYVIYLTVIREFSAYILRTKLVCRAQECFESAERSKRWASRENPFHQQDCVAVDLYTGCSVWKGITLIDYWLAHYLGNNGYHFNRVSENTRWINC